MPGDGAKARRRTSSRNARRAPAPRSRRALEFYASALDEAERLELDRAAEIEGLDAEIAVLRTKLRSAVEKHKEDIPLMLRGMDLLMKALSARYRLSPASARDLSDSLADVIKGVGAQLYPERFRDE